MDGKYKVGETVNGSRISEGPYHDPTTNGPYYIIYDVDGFGPYPITERALTERR